MKFSVIIPTCDRIDHLILCLEALTPTKQNFPSALFEVIVSDDGKISSEDVIKKRFAWVQWVKGPRKGPAANRNNGAKYAKGEWLAFTDDDCLPKVDWLENYHAAINNNRSIQAFEGAIYAIGNLNQDFVECPVNLEGGCFWSANICIKKELFYQVKGFDENYTLPAHEDQDLYLRIKNNTSVLFVKEAQVGHPVRRNSIWISIKKIKERSLTWSYFAWKNKNPLNYHNDWGIIKAGYKSQIRASYNALKRWYPRKLLYSLAMLAYGMPLIFINLFIKNKLRHRKFNWISSKTGNSSLLDELNNKLSVFYSQKDCRDTYQKMLDEDEPLPSKGDFSHLIIDYIISNKPNTILDVGCGSGRVYRHLMQFGFSGKYTGIEVAPYLIDINKIRYPEATWETAGAYSIPFTDDKFDLCFAFFVLEHLVYPEKALTEMMRVLKKSGSLILIFPDFIKSERLSSQQLGFSPNDTSIQKLKKGKVIDALISLYDSRIRLPKALKKVHEKVGEFPINTNLICFNYPEQASPDFDAVYIASKEEVDRWATNNGYKATYPFGEKGELNEKAFMVIIK